LKGVEFAEVRQGQESVERGRVCWGEVEKVGECRVSHMEVMSVDCWGDMVCTGDMTGGVGITMGGRTLGLKPHHLCVCRTVFVGDEGSLGVLSGSHDGTVRYSDLQAGKVSCEARWDRREVRWVEPEQDTASCLINLDGKEIVRLDRREKRVGNSVLKVEPLGPMEYESGRVLAWTSVKDHPKVGSNISLCPNRPHLMSFVSGLSVLVYDLRSTTKPLHTLSHQGGSSSKGWSGASWSTDGSYLMGCQASGHRGDQMEAVVWESGELGKDLPMLSWPSAESKSPYDGTSFSYYYGANWCPWQDGVFLTTARINNKLSNKKVASYWTVVAVDVTTNSVVSELTRDLSYQTYCITSHPTKPILIVANTNMPGMMATYKYVTA